MSLNGAGSVITGGWQKPTRCWGQLGGVKSIYVIPASYITAFSFNQYEIITGITRIDSIKKWFEIGQVNETATYNQKEIYDEKVGSYFYQQRANIIFHENSATNRLLFLQFRNSKFYFIVRDNNDRYFLNAYRNQARAGESEIQWNSKYSDLNGTSFFLLASEPVPAFEVLPSAIAVSTTRFSLAETELPDPGPPSGE